MRLKFDESEIKYIGDIGNYYGSLELAERDGKYYWGIEDYDGTEYEEIPKYLADALIKLKDEEDQK